MQLHVANLSGAAAMGVTATIERLTAWPNPFDLENSKILRDLSFLRPHEVLKFDVGFGPQLFENNVPAEFRVTIAFASLDGRSFSFDDKLRIESVEGHSHYQIYSVDDVARRLKEISDALRGVIVSGRLRVDTYDADDRDMQRRAWEEQRVRMTRREGGSDEIG